MVSDCYLCWISVVYLLDKSHLCGDVKFDKVEITMREENLFSLIYLFGIISPRRIYIDDSTDAWR